MTALAYRSKKGIFLTLTAFLLLSIVFTALLFQNRYTFSEKNKIVNVKTTTLNAFVTNLDADVARGLFIAGFRSVIAAEQVISDSKNFLNDSKANLLEAVMNGTINSEPAPIMVQSTLPEWLPRIKANAAIVGILLNFSFISLTVDQTTPWSVDYVAAISFNVTDLTGTATFFRSRNVSASVTILGFKDPLYTIFTNGKISREINITPYEGNYVSGLDTANLQAHINGLYYTTSTGPNFLMRLEGKLTDSITGIESIVRLPDLQAQGIPVFERSSVDYVYFGNSTPPIYIINNTFEDWFRLDDAHLSAYQASSLAK